MIDLVNAPEGIKSRIVSTDREVFKLKLVAIDFKQEVGISMFQI